MIVADIAGGSGESGRYRKRAALMLAAVIKGGRRLRWRPVRKAGGG
jgi:hypothetical protein